MQNEVPEEILGQLRALYAPGDEEPGAWLLREIVRNALKFKAAGLDVLDLKIMNRALAEYRYAASVFKPYRAVRKVSIFGSARTPENDPYYEMAVRFSRALAQRGFMTITGAASGIMKAGNLGAGAERSFGANILLPFEQAANEIMSDDPKLITFRYFFTRKLFFLMEAHAVALFPGGFGTHDEGFEALTLLQTGKAPPMPIVLMDLPGEDYWESWRTFVESQMLARGLISGEDLALYRIVYSPGEAVEWIVKFYSTYHSMRWVRDKLVLRLEAELSDRQVRDLDAAFADLLETGAVEKSDPLPAEANEPELLSKPRLAFAYNRKSAGRLVALIHAINDMGMAATQG